MSEVSTTEAERGQAGSTEVLARAKAMLQEGRFAEVEALMRVLLREQPELQEAWYFQAVSQRYLQHYPAALASLAELQARHPEYGRAWQEEGHVHLAGGDNSRARQAFLKAVARNNSLLSSWQALLELAQGAGDEALRGDAVEQVRRLSALPQELLGVRNMMAEGSLLKAEKLCRSFLQRNPKHVEGMRLLAALGVKTQVLDDAEFLLESALVFEPDNKYARFDYMNVLYQRQKYAQSLQQAQLLLDSEPGNDTYKNAYANQCVAVGKFEEALALYAEIGERVPNNAQLHLLRGHTLKTIGRLDEAIAAYRASYAAKADLGDAFWSLANLKTYQFTAREISQMRREEESASTGLDDRIHLCFALGKALEDAGQFGDAAEYYIRGNQLKKDELQYSAERMTQQLQLQHAWCTEALFQASSGFGCPAADPIFIVGLPRAGSTLLEQILASHSQVDGTLELQNIPALAHRLDGRRTIHEEPRYPHNLQQMTAEKAQKFGEAYIEETRIHRAGAPFFIDKMPNNFRHIGLIHLILPNAKIIDARRHPMACCFSGFKQLFAEGQEFTYGLREIGQYYRDYAELMEHWEAVLPGKILRVQYEDVVADLDGQVQRLLEHCGLPFEQQCIDFHQTQRSVRTPSSEQVRQPIYSDGLEQWRNFESHLDPLRQALGPAL